MKYEKITILMTLAMLLFICSLSTISAANINVDNSTSSIKQGLDSAAPSGDTILLAPGNYTGTNNTGLTISKNVTIQGNGPTEQVIIDAQKLNRMFIIGNGYNVTFINITFINGNTSTNGGSIYNNYFNSMITILNCQFINNTAAVHAGAIYNIGNNMTVSDSIFTGNTATGSASGGGAIQNRGNNTVIANSTFNDNVAGNYGGAIHSEGDNFVIANSTFTNNRAISSGGALWLREWIWS